jgi:CRISPR-associated protein Csd2
MCHNFFDIRSFGAVMTTEVNCGQVRGPIQLGIARSIDPIAPQEYAITRCAVTNERDIEKERTFGRKFAVPYALYRVHGYVNPCLAAQTMFSDEDLALFRQAIGQMFEYDRSANRGQMCPRKCVAFRHESKLGNARADQLFALVKATLKSELRETERPPRKFEDYVLSVDEANVPKDIYLEQWI